MDAIQRVWILMLVLSLVAAEELTKLAIYVWRDQRSTVARPEHFIYLGLSTALGLVSSEIFFAVRSLAYATSADGTERVAPSTVVWTVIIFSGFLTPMQMLASYYIGLAAARVQVLGQLARSALPGPVAIAVLFRTLFLAAIIIVALPGSVALGFALAIAVFGAFVVVVLRFQEGMPADYLRSTGHLNVLGYGVLPDSDEAATAAAPGAAGGNGQGAAPQSQRGEGDAAGSADAAANSTSAIAGEYGSNKQRLPDADVGAVVHPPRSPTATVVVVVPDATSSS
jgi:hypothetical protein